MDDTSLLQPRTFDSVPIGVAVQNS